MFVNNMTPLTIWLLLITVLAVILFGGKLHEGCFSSALPSCPLCLENRGLVLKEGFDFEEYDLTTEDGYTVTLGRIVKRKSPPRGHPILFFNGISIRSGSWILRGRKEDLAFMLAERGYDVWLGDQRSNPEPKDYDRHRKMGKEYWDFSFHETGVYDLPTLIDFILNKTSKSQISYVGVSLGATYFFVLMSEKEEYRNKIASSVLLAPVGVPQKLTKLKRYNKGIFKLTTTVLDVLQFAGIDESNIQPVVDFVRTLLKIFCNPSLFQPACTSILEGFFGKINENNLHEKYLGYYLAGSIGRTSYKTWRHSISTITKGRLCKYDYGKETNMKIYGNVEPPNYNFSVVTVPTAIFYGDEDDLTPYEATDITVKLLGNYGHPYLFTGYNHIDFLLGKSAPEIVNVAAIKFFNSFTKKSEKINFCNVR